MQDIAGCRVVVTGTAEQLALLGILTSLYPDAAVFDRRSKPSHGYRAIHVVVPHGARWVEIQVRTLLQQRWAEFSEKLADHFGAGLKYGNGNSVALNILAKLSDRIRDVEELEVRAMVDPSDRLLSEITSAKNAVQGYLDSMMDVVKEFERSG